MKIGDTFLHCETETARKVVDIIQKSSGTLYVVRDVVRDVVGDVVSDTRKKESGEYIVRPENIGKDYYKPLDPKEMQQIEFLVKHPDFRLNLTPILKSSAKLFDNLTTLKGIYRTAAGKIYYIDSKDTVLGRSDFFIPTSLKKLPETRADYAGTRFVFWEWNCWDKVVAHSSSDWKVEYFENGTMVMTKLEHSILVVPGQNSFLEADLCKILLPREFQGAPITYKVRGARYEPWSYEPWSTTTRVLGDLLETAEPTLYDIKAPCDSREPPRKKLIYMPADPTCPMDGGEVFETSALTLHASPLALFASSEGSRDMCSTREIETERTLEGSWKEPRGSLGGYSNYFLEFISPYKAIILYQDEYKLAIGKTKRGDLVVNKRLDLEKKYGWLQDIVYISKNTELYGNVRASYKAPDGEVFKIDHGYRVALSANSDKLENIEFKAFADLEGITYGITKKRAIDMQTIEVF